MRSPWKGQFKMLCNQQAQNFIHSSNNCDKSINVNLLASQIQRIKQANKCKSYPLFFEDYIFQNIAYLPFISTEQNQIQGVTNFSQVRFTSDMCHFYRPKPAYSNGTHIIIFTLILHHDGSLTSASQMLKTVSKTDSMTYLLTNLANNHLTTSTWKKKLKPED